MYIWAKQRSNQAAGTANTICFTIYELIYYGKRGPWRGPPAFYVAVIYGS